MLKKKEKKSRPNIRTFRKINGKTKEKQTSPLPSPPVKNIKKKKNRNLVRHLLYQLYRPSQPIYLNKKDQIKTLFIVKNGTEKSVWQTTDLAKKNVAHEKKKKKFIANMQMLYRKRKKMRYKL